VTNAPSAAYRRLLTPALARHRRRASRSSGAPRASRSVTCTAQTMSLPRLPGPLIDLTAEEQQKKTLASLQNDSLMDTFGSLPLPPPLQVDEMTFSYLLTLRKGCMKRCQGAAGQSLRAMGCQTAVYPEVSARDRYSHRRSVCVCVTRGLGLPTQPPADGQRPRGNAALYNL
jgi:hypothetical protein